MRFTMIRALQCCLLAAAAWLSAVTLSTVTETRALPRALSVARVLMNELVVSRSRGTGSARVMKLQRVVVLPPEAPKAPKSERRGRAFMSRPRPS